MDAVWRARGGPRGRRGAKAAGLLHAAGISGVVVIAGAVPALIILETWSTARAEKAAWDGITGPACPGLEGPPPWARTEASAARVRPPMTFRYGEASFTRQHGHASCAGFRREGAVYRICQFNAPAVLTVTTPRGTAAYRPGSAQPTTVTVRDGRISCILGGWFRS